MSMFFTLIYLVKCLSLHDCVLWLRRSCIIAVCEVRAVPRWCLVAWIMPGSKLSMAIRICCFAAALFVLQILHKALLQRFTFNCWSFLIFFLSLLPWGHCFIWPYCITQLTSCTQLMHTIDGFHLMSLGLRKFRKCCKPLIPEHTLVRSQSCFWYFALLLHLSVSVAWRSPRIVVDSALSLCSIGMLLVHCSFDKMENAVCRTVSVNEFVHLQLVSCCRVFWWLKC